MNIYRHIIAALCALDECLHEHAPRWVEHMAIRAMFCIWIHQEWDLME